MSTAKKTIKSNSSVKVYNNIFNNVGFETASGRRIELPRNGSWKDVKVEDLDYVLSIAPAMIKEGILYIEDKAVREYLDIDDLYESKVIIASKDIENLLEEKPEILEEILKNASKSTKAEIAKKAQEKVEDLTGGQVRVIEKETGMEITDKL